MVHIVYCRAKGCNNKRVIKRNVLSEICFFPIPDPKKKPKLCKQWLHNLGTGLDFKTYKYQRYNAICEEHFEEDAFLEDIEAKIMNLPRQRKILKEDAVPTIFLHRKIRKRRLRTERRLEAKRKREMVDKLLKEHVETKEEPKSVAEHLQNIKIKKEPVTESNEDTMDVVQMNQLPDTATQFSLAEECTRMIASSQNQTKAQDEIPVIPISNLVTKEKNVTCKCACACGLGMNTVGTLVKCGTAPPRGKLNLESLLPREPDQVILIRVNVSRKAVVMVDSATQVDCNVAEKEVQTGMDPELKRVSTEFVS